MKNLSTYFVISFLLILTEISDAQNIIVKGNVSASANPVKFALVTFINENDTTKKFTSTTDASGNYELEILTGIKWRNNNLPAKFEIEQNYPNPFSSSTSISYKLNMQSDVDVRIYDILGREIKNISASANSAGAHTVLWDGTNSIGKKVAAGIYFYRIQAGGETKVKKMVFAADGKTINFPNLQNGLISPGYIKKEIPQNFPGKTANMFQGKYTVQVSNTDKAEPRIIYNEFPGISINNDTTINLITDKIDTSAFAIYFLKDTTVRYDKIINKDLTRVILASTPWLTAKDISFYDWSDHFLYLNNNKSAFFPSDPNFLFTTSSWAVKPWIVVSGGRPCYSGYFISMIFSMRFPAPWISEFELTYYPDDILTSEGTSISDIRNNLNIKEALVKNGIYHGGIEITFDSSADGVVKIIKGDTTAVEYTIKIKNNDADDLYIFDPGKVDTKIFHYYNNGPYFSNQNGVPFSSQYKKVTDPGGWDSTWYSLLKSGESITRTVILKGYPDMPADKYNVSLQYGCPNINKDIRITAKGRYWIGKVSSNRIHLIVQ